MVCRKLMCVILLVCVRWCKVGSWGCWQERWLVGRYTPGRATSPSWSVTRGQPSRTCLRHKGSCRIRWAPIYMDVFSLAFFKCSRITSPQLLMTVAIIISRWFLDTALYVFWIHYVCTTINILHLVVWQPYLTLGSTNSQVTVGFGRGAFMWGWRLGLFCSTFMLFTTSIATYRGKSSVVE